MADEDDRTVEPADAADPAAGSGSAAVREDDRSEPTLAEELVEESHEAVVEVSPEMGETKADPGAGGIRFDELVAKRKGMGLSDEESEELGRLMAQRDGREWTSTRQLRQHPPDTAS